MRNKCCTILACLLCLYFITGCGVKPITSESNSENLSSGQTNISQSENAGTASFDVRPSSDANTHPETSGTSSKSSAAPATSGTVSKISNSPTASKTHSAPTQYPAPKKPNFYLDDSFTYLASNKGEVTFRPDRYLDVGAHGL